MRFTSVTGHLMNYEFNTKSKWVLEETKNELPLNGLKEIHAADSKVKILVIATNEEQEIASQCYDLLTS